MSHLVMLRSNLCHASFGFAFIVDLDAQSFYCTCMTSSAFFTTSALCVLTALVSNAQVEQSKADEYCSSFHAGLDSALSLAQNLEDSKLDAKNYAQVFTNIRLVLAAIKERMTMLDKEMTREEYMTAATELKGPDTGKKIMAFQEMMKSTRELMANKNYCDSEELKTVYSQFYAACEAFIE